MSSLCSICDQLIQQSDPIRLLGEFVVHSKCARCDSCGKQFETGEQIGLKDRTPACLDCVNGQAKGSDETHSQSKKARQPDPVHPSEYGIVPFLYDEASIPQPVWLGATSRVKCTPEEMQSLELLWEGLRKMNHEVPPNISPFEANSATDNDPSLLDINLELDSDEFEIQQILDMFG